MHGGTRSGDNVMNGGKIHEKWVRKSARPMPTFDPQKETKAYQMEIKEILRPEWVILTSSMPPICDRTMLEKPLGNVSNLIEFLISCVELMKYETLLNVINEMIDHFMQ